MQNKKAEFPKEITRGGITVTIYHARRMRAGRASDEFTLVSHYKENGRRKRQRSVFASLAAAKVGAEFAITKLENGQHDALALTGTAREEYVAAVAELKRTGRPLLTAVREYCDAFDQLGGKSTLQAAVDFFATHFDPDMPTKTVREVADELLAAKKADGLSEVYRKDLRLRLATFCASYGSRPIASVRSTVINGWLRALELSPRSRNNFRSHIVQLFHFAKSAGYLPKDRTTEADDLARAKVKSAHVEIFTPAEVRLILSRLNADLLPFAAIAAFAGVRSEELMRLDWKDIRFDEGVIEVAADKSKTQSHRHVPISANLLAWLAPYKRRAGKVCRWKKTQLMVQTAAEARVEENGGTVQEGVAWKHNGLRHSFGSYRMAEIKNAAQVSLEMGNSPRMVFAHYRKPILAKDASDYFSIFPAESNVIALGNQASA